MHRMHSSPPHKEHRAGGLAEVRSHAGAVIQRHFPAIMRGALALVFLWFGALKVANVSPVSKLVADTLFFIPLPQTLLVTGLGVFEIAVAAALVTGRWLRPILPLLLLHLVGTFSVLLIHPALAFQGGNPLLLTVEGEFVIKNVVLIAGTLMVSATLPPREKTSD
ncbi:hypothetical protein Ssi02_26950 [Sinosporangium siamense]|uniref:Membrane protein YkgB n=1 Tax=Sinosporangium siamense TaxID=1367973 RepID=A0A919VBT8_9ACTN|nr:hypothetical protein Ssi02_26950 [Sinosporangium siamense]